MTCLCFLDDIILFSVTFASHIQCLLAVLQVFRSAGLQLVWIEACTGAIARPITFSAVPAPLPITLSTGFSGGAPLAAVCGAQITGIAAVGYS